jgi:hypothetical protein
MELGGGGQIELGDVGGGRMELGGVDGGRR